MYKKLFIVLILSLITTFTYAQKKTKKISANDGNIKEVYYVLKDSMSIKQGEYKKWVGDNYCIFGQYNNDERCGIWNTYSFGNLIFSYDNDNKKVVFDAMNECLNDTSVYRGINAPFLTNVDVLRNKLISNTRYPQDAREKGKMGTVVISITVDSLGNAIKSELKTGVYKSLDEEALKVIKLLLPIMKFYPGTKNGQFVESVICFPFKFNLQ